LALLASLLVVAGLGIRGVREGRESRFQVRAGWMEAGTATVWLAAGAVFGAWRLGVHDAADLMYRWPSPTLIASSTLALLAALMSVVMAIQLRKVWNGERRIIGWSTGRKLRHSLTVLVYLAFALVLGAWGGLAPWSS
jgi:hypothetical protein